MIIKKAFLDQLFTLSGQDTTNEGLHLAIAQLKDDVPLWGKWKPYLKAQEDDRFIEKCNNRSILTHEIVLDFDLKQGESQDQLKDRYEKALNGLDTDGMGYKAYFTGSKGYHIHLIFPELKQKEANERKRIKEAFISSFGCDIQKAGRSMIALEHTAHWKTGLPKKLLKEKEGNNILPPINTKETEENFSKTNFILNPDEVYQRKPFVCGRIKDQFYFGLLLPKWEEVYTKDGRLISKKQVYKPAIINSQRELLEISEDLEKKHKTIFLDVPSDLPIRWGLDSIDQFNRGITIIPSLYQVYLLIYEQYKKYIDMSEEWILTHTVWDMATYYHQMFKKFPIFELRGLKGTSKTKTMFQSSQVSFNATDIMTNPSEATLFRETNDKRPTKYIDEAEKLFTFKNGKIEADLRAEVINSSYSYEGSVPRQEKEGNKFVTKNYKTYSPTMVASINGLYGATEDRAIIRITTKPRDKDSKKSDIELSKEDYVWQDIRNKLYITTLVHYKQVYDEYSKEDNNTKLQDREYWLWKGLLAVAKVIDQDVYDKLLNHAEKQQSIKRIDSMPEDSLEADMLRAFWILLQSENIVYVKNIRQKLIGDEDRKPKERSITNKVDKLGFRDFKGKDRNGAFYEINQSDFQSIVMPILPSIFQEDYKNDKKSSQSSQSSQNSLVIEEEVKNHDVTKRDDCDESENRHNSSQCDDFKNQHYRRQCDENDDKTQKIGVEATSCKKVIIQALKESPKRIDLLFKELIETSNNKEKEIEVSIEELKKYGYICEMPSGTLRLL